MEGLASPAELQALEAFISSAFASHQLQDPAVVAVEKIGARPAAWYVRFSGEAKANYSAEFTLNQRSLHFSTYFIPPPEENENEFHRHLLQRNAKLFGMAFVVGQENAIYIEGRLSNRLIMEDGELDRILGSLFAYTEQFFPTAARIGFASRFS